MPQNKKSSHDSSLRKSAEAKLQEKSEKNPLLKTEDVPKIVHELEVHQAELEIQNEELRQSQVELTDSRNSYEALYDFAPVGYITLDYEGRILKSNRTTEKMIGIEGGKLTRRFKFSSFVSPQCQDIWHKYRLEVLECKGKKASCELEIIKADKSLLNVNLETICTPSPDKKEPLLMMAMIDITERKKAEEALRESEERFRLVLKNMPVITATLDRDLRYTWVYNPLSGFTSEQVIGKKVGLSTTPEATKNIIKILRVLLSSGEPVSFETRVERETGLKFFESHAEALRNSKGEITGIALISIDITDRKSAEEEIKNVARFPEENPNPVVRVSYEGNVLYANKACAILWGIKKGDPLPAKLVESIREVERTGKNLEMEIESGERIFNLNFAFIPGFEYVNIYGRDITERKRAGVALQEAYENLQTQSEELQAVNEELQSQSEELQSQSEELQAVNEELLIQSEKLKAKSEELLSANEGLEKTNKELEQFAYVASHDLQEPLRMVASFAQLLEKRYKDQFDKDALEYFTFIVDGAKRMQQLVQDLLQFSRIGRMDTETDLVDCNDIIDKAALILKTSIDNTGAEVTYDDLPVLNANETRLIQLFQNLIGNAIKFRKKEETPRIHISARRNSGHWLFSVKDNGMGISPKYFEKIFVIFQRLNDRDEYSGTGIGLAICKKIAELNGGRIWVESAEGEGATFYFTFPV